MKTEIRKMAGKSASSRVAYFVVSLRTKSHVLLSALLLIGLSQILTALILPASALAQDRLAAVRIRGNERIEEQTILLQVTTHAGSSFDHDKVENDVKELYKTGFFEQVVAKREVEAGKPILVFQVVEKPAIRQVLLEGNDAVGNDTLKEKLSIGERRFLDRRKIKAGIEEARKYYLSKGYYSTVITVAEKPAEGNQVDLTYTVNEGKKKVIRNIIFEGNHAVESSDLEDVIKTSTYRWWSSWITGSGILDKDKLENDQKELQNYYLSHGYVEVKVGEPKIQEIDEGLQLTFAIQEGEVFKFNNISASGTLLPDGEAKTLEGIESKSGETFDVTKLRKDTFTVSEKFSDVGYAFANVEPETQVNHQDRTVNINFKIDKGSLITVNRVSITGNKKTADNVIRRSLKVHEQELFSSSKVKKSQELLRRLGYFDEVTVTPEPSDTDQTVDLNIGVKEAQTGSFSFGAGVSSGEGFIATARVSENNFLGTGKIVSFDVNTGSRRQNLVLSYEDPRLDDTRWALGADLLSTSRKFDDFDRHEKGGAFTLGHPLTFLGEEYEDDINFSAKYEYLDIKIDNLSAVAPDLVRRQEGGTTESSVTPRIVRNTIDNPIDPEKGSKQNVSVELAGLGGEQKFWLGEASNSWYYPVIELGNGNLVFSQRTRFGYGDTFNGDQFPLFKRYFLGGINSVRGFQSRAVGPKDTNRNPFGGSKELVANFELLAPIVKSAGIKGLVFYDAGNAYDDNETIDIGSLRQAVGFGIRWRSPIAPIRIEFGWPIDREKGDRSFVTNFTFGAPQ